MKSADIKEENSNLHDLGDDLKAYADIRLQIIRLNVTEKVAFAISGFLSMTITWLFVIFFILFAGIGAAKWVGLALNNEMLGFIIVAGAYLSIALIARLIASSKIKSVIANGIINDFSKDDKDEQK